MDGRTATGRQRLSEAVERAHEAMQEAHAALYEVQLSTERAENDLLAAGMPAEATPEYAEMRQEVSELRPLLVPIVRWLQRARREVGPGPQHPDNSPNARQARGLEPIRPAKRGGTHGA